MGFTRVDAPSDENPERGWAPLSRRDATWLPAAEVHGEGLFIQLSETAVDAWVERSTEREQLILDAHMAWCARRGLENPRERFPGIRAVLVHSLAHALMRQLALESGYSQAAIRERLYSRSGGEGGPMAGILLYTAAPGSEGTLGGIVALGAHARLGRILEGALRDATLCNSDPLCAEPVADDEGLSANGAACYACMFAPETSCELANRYLDRGCLADLITGVRAGYFPTPAR